LAHSLQIIQVGVVPDLAPSEIALKGRLEPGKMFLVDFERGGIVHDDALKAQVANKREYGAWLEQNLVRLDDWTANSRYFCCMQANLVPCGSSGIVVTRENNLAVLPCSE
jgi:hypothetical protein